MNLKQNLTKIWTTISKWPWCDIFLCVWSFWCALYTLRIAYYGWVIGYATVYCDCEPPLTMEQCDNLITSGLCWGVPTLISGIYFLCIVIKWFKENKVKKQ